MSSTIIIADAFKGAVIGFVLAIVLSLAVYGIGRAADDDPYWKLKGEWTVLAQGEGGVEQVKCHYVAGVFDEEAADIWLPANFHCPPSLHSI